MSGNKKSNQGNHKAGAHKWSKHRKRNKQKMCTNCVKHIVCLTTLNAIGLGCRHFRRARK